MCFPQETLSVRFCHCFPTDSSVLSWSFWPKKRSQTVKKVTIRRCTDTEENQVDLMLKPFEPSVCCDPCGWSQEYPVSAELHIPAHRQPMWTRCLCIDCIMVLAPIEVPVYSRLKGYTWRVQMVDVRSLRTVFQKHLFNIYISAPETWALQYKQTQSKHFWHIYEPYVILDALKYWNWYQICKNEK